MCWFVRCYADTSTDTPPRRPAVPPDCTAPGAAHTCACCVATLCTQANQSSFSISLNWTGPSSSIPIVSAARTVFCSTINVAAAGRPSIETLEIEMIYFRRKTVSNESEMSRIAIHSIKIHFCFKNCCEHRGTGCG